MDSGLILCHALSEDTAFFNIHNPQTKPFSSGLGPSFHQKDTSKIKNLIFSFHLFEFIFVHDYTAMVDDSLTNIALSGIFPNLSNVYFLYSTAKIDLDKIRKNGYNLKKIHLNYFLLRSGDTKHLCKNFRTPNWTPDNNALFLVGSPFRFNRLPIIHEFDKRNRLDLLEYSLDYSFSNNCKTINELIEKNSYHFDRYSKLMFDGDNNKLIDFLISKRRVVDFATPGFRRNNVFDRSAYVIPNQWFDSSLILCMETHFFDLGYDKSGNEFNIFTEKFWKTVLTRKPFVISSYNDHYYHKIERLGFRTFLKYTSVPEKVAIDTFESEKHIMDEYSKISYKRVTSFLTNMKTDQDLIKDDIEHNYNVWVKLVDDEWNKLVSQCPPLSSMNRIHINSMFLMNNP